MNRLAQYRKEIEERSKPEDKEILLKFLDTCKTNAQFQVFARCKWIGGPKYKRVWSPCLELIKLMKALK